MDSSLAPNYIANSPGRAYILSSVSNLSLSKNDKGDKDIGYLEASVRACVCVHAHTCRCICFRDLLEEGETGERKIGLGGTSPRV